MADGYDGGPDSGPSLTPRPDPTLLTTAALTREIAALRESMTLNLKGEIAAVVARLDAADKAVDLLEKERDRMPAEIEAKIFQHEAKETERYNTITEKFNRMEEKFAGVALQFEERDVRVKESALAATTAVNAALQAAKEAVGEQNRAFGLSIGKSEEATAKQIDQLSRILETALAGIAVQIADIKERLVRNEALAQGAANQSFVARQEQGVSQGERGLRQGSTNLTSNILFGVFGAVALVAGIVIALVGVIVK